MQPENSILLFYLQHSTFVGAVGAYDRAGSVFEYDSSSNFSFQDIAERKLKVAFTPPNLSAYKDSYLGKHRHMNIIL